MYRIRRFGVVKTATMVAVMYLLVIAIFLLPIAGLIVAFSPINAGAGAISVLTIGLLIALFYAVFGWIVTAVACVLYNFVAGWVGGIEVQVEPVTPPPPVPVWGPPTR
jgi:prepilin signal peptidase PulO-like enzyme (type II secretory pathway)